MVIILGFIAKLISSRSLKISKSVSLSIELIIVVIKLSLTKYKLRQTMKLIIISLILIFTNSCIQNEPEHKWLSGNEYERLDTVAKHLRGNDLVMWEVDFRHKKLYEAIKTYNKPYALYQLKKIELTMELGSERRSKRKKSYDWFFTNAIPAMQEAIENDHMPMEEFKSFTAKCVTCHTMEKVAYMPVIKPWE